MNALVWFLLEMATGVLLTTAWFFWNRDALK